MMINRQSIGLKGQLNLAQAILIKPGVALGWGSEDTTVRAKMHGNELFYIRTL
jgi:hypothetical protein